MKPQTFRADGSSMMQDKWMASSLAALALLPLSATADPETYIGAGYGAYQFEENSIDQSDSYWKGYIGTMFSSAVGMELSFVDFSRATDQGSTFDADGYGAALVLAFPMTENFALYAKGGLYFWDAESSFAGISANDDGDDPFYGAGLKFRLNEALDLRVEYERYEIANIDLDGANASLQFSF